MSDTLAFINVILDGNARVLLKLLLDLLSVNRQVDIVLECFLHHLLLPVTVSPKYWYLLKMFKLRTKTPNIDALFFFGLDVHIYVLFIAIERFRTHESPSLCGISLDGNRHDFWNQSSLHSFLPT